MSEWFCTKCNMVFHSKKLECCGFVEEFDLKKHTEFLIGKSNSWITIWNKWKDHPILRKITEECHEEGVYGAAIVLNIFIEFLDKEYYIGRNKE